METNGTTWACGGNEAVYYHRNSVKGGASCCGGCWHSCSDNKPRKLTLTSLFGLQQLKLNSRVPLHCVWYSVNNQITVGAPAGLIQSRLWDMWSESAVRGSIASHSRLISISLKQNTRHTACWENTNTTTNQPEPGTWITICCTCQGGRGRLVLHVGLQHGRRMRVNIEILVSKQWAGEQEFKTVRRRYEYCISRPQQCLIQASQTWESAAFLILSSLYLGLLGRKRAAWRCNLDILCQFYGQNSIDW